MSFGTGLGTISYSPLFAAASRVAVGLQGVRRGFAGAAVGQELCEPLRAVFIGRGRRTSVVGAPDSKSWIMTVIHEAPGVEKHWGRSGTESISGTDQLRRRDEGRMASEFIRDALI